MGKLTRLWGRPRRGGSSLSLSCRRGMPLLAVSSFQGRSVRIPVKLAPVHGASWPVVGTYLLLGNNVIWI